MIRLRQGYGGQGRRGRMIIQSFVTSAPVEAQGKETAERGAPQKLSSFWPVIFL